MKKFLFLLLTVVFCSCATSPNEEEYGYVENQPILVGGDDLEKGPDYETAYLRSLSGPNGELVYFDRTGSCCEFETENSPTGKGMLDTYDVTYDGLEEPIVLYLNMYDPNPEPAKAPQGFKLKE